MRWRTIDERLMQDKKTQGRIAETWVNGKIGLHICAVYFGHTNGVTPRNEAIMEAVLKCVAVYKRELSQ